VDLIINILEIKVVVTSSKMNKRLRVPLLLPLKMMSSLIVMDIIHSKPVLLPPPLVTSVDLAAPLERTP
jgi:hypothetical protein